MVARKKVVPVIAERTETCKACRFANFSKTEGLFCRRYPPAFVYDYQTGTSNARWPEVNADAYCGEFAAQLSS